MPPLQVDQYKKMDLPYKVHPYKPVEVGMAIVQRATETIDGALVESYYYGHVYMLTKHGHWIKFYDEYNEYMSNEKYHLHPHTYYDEWMIDERCF